MSAISGDDQGPISLEGPTGRVDGGSFQGSFKSLHGGHFGPGFIYLFIYIPVISVLGPG